MVTSFRWGRCNAPDLVASADGATLYVGESGGALHRYEVGEATLEEVDATVDGGSRNVVLTGDEQFVFYGGTKVRASNLKNVLGSFNDEIWAANTDGSRAVSSSKVFDGNTFAIIGLLPFTTKTMALAPDDRTLYLYDIGLSRVYVFDIGTL